MTNIKKLAIIIFLISTYVFAYQAYSLETRYTKFDENGIKLPNDSQKWSIIYDSATHLYWEVKDDTDKIHSKSNVYSYSNAKIDFIAKLNEIKFGGFSDWRLPTLIELTEIQEKSDEVPYINQNIFPHTTPSDYISWEICGNGDILPKKVSFGKQKAKKKSRYVRAVRGSSPEGFDRY